MALSYRAHGNLSGSHLNVASNVASNVVGITDSISSACQNGAMNRRNQPLPIMPRVLLVLAIWMLALLISACSTSIEFSKPVSQQARNTNMSVQTDVAHDPQQKKIRFFATLKPLVISENSRILQLREKLLEFRGKPALSSRQQVWLKQVAAQYGLTLDGAPDYQQWQALLARVDIVPLEMALAQAANESGWGESRFAREANNYFGQWCYKKGCGVIPKRRNPGAIHEVRRFDNARASVRAYLQNINTAKAYADFRNIRQSLRVQSRPLDAQLLASGLKSYSERGMAYVRTIRSMIRSNRKLIASS